MPLKSLLPELANDQNSDIRLLTDLTESGTDEAAVHADHATCHGSVSAILEYVSAHVVVRPIVFDRTHTLARLGGLEDLLREVLHTMLQEAPKCHARMSAAFRGRAATELSRAAHTLKGSASIVGANDLCRRLLKIEKLAAALDFAAIADELTEVGRQFEELLDCLRTELDVAAGERSSWQ